MIGALYFCRLKPSTQFWSSSALSISSNVWNDLVMMTPVFNDEMRLLFVVLSPLMKVLMPVIVARGISTNSFTPSLSEPGFLRRHAAAIQFLLFMYQFRWRFRSSRRRESRATKKERNAEKDTMITAKEASTWCQNVIHLTSTVPFPIRIFETRITAMRIIKIERHRVAPKINFWRKLTWMRQSCMSGMISTK